MRITIFILLLLITGQSSAQIRLNDNVILSGFGTASAAISDSSVKAYNYRNIDNHLCLDCDSTLGLQLDWLINKDFRSSVQVVKRPQDTFSDPELEWAYLAYTQQNSTLKLGRQRLPLFIMSEYYYVSAAYPWSRPPQDVYDNIMGITHYDGISYEWTTLTSSESQLRIAPFVAIPQTSDYNGYGIDFSLDFKTTLGITIDYTYQDSVFHLGYINTSATRYNDVGLPKTHYSLDMITAGFNIVDGNITYTAEALLDQNLYATWYSGISYQYQNIQPYLQYGQRRRMFSDNSIIGGIKTSITPSLFINLEWAYVTGPDSYQSGHLNEMQLTGDRETNANIYTLSVSFLF
ncbi:sulfate ABC transporter permease [Vibrio salinus]|uniref:sulfate ABC transporter permease n=1 Tax=Vibrio salinus TaxID=2899784 RepID=UPI001E5C9B14|nr:sulfate ABC transporter permease [Vibrio salinus]MCE0495325.1 sulfate ABC transporter permease [Vibrio salinus]